MESSRHQRITELFLRASEMEAAERKRFLESECSEDEGLLAEVLELLEHDSVTLGVVDGEVSVDPAVLRAFTEENQPDRIGPYTILGVLGEGGMGTVFRAQQEQPFREVALKVIRTGFADQATTQRFQLESELLGRLRHAGIAQVFEAGVSDGTPFFAMELVQGVPLDRWAEKEDPSSADALEIIADIADAVAHANSNGVVHRDIKPSNILVDAHGQAKILDFGIARLADDSGKHTLLTQAGQLVGTLPYMSPEQAVGDPNTVDGRTDVYSLGVVAFELLGGRLPIEMGQEPLSKSLRRIAEEDPPLLGGIDRHWKGDVETIIARALEKDPIRRYATAHDFSEDIHRFLAHEPIRARPQSALYQISKLARRHRAIFAGMAVALMALITGLIFSLSEQRKAESALEDSEAVVTFLGDLLSSVGPDKIGREALVSDALSLASERMDALASRGGVRARVQALLGSSWITLGDSEKGVTFMEDAVVGLQEHVGENDRRSHRAQVSLVSAYISLGRLTEAAAESDKLTARTTNQFPETHEVVQEARYLEAQVLQQQGQYEEAQVILEALDQEAEGSTMETWGLRILLAKVYHSAGEFAKGTALMRKTIEEAEQMLGPDHWRILPWRTSLVGMLSRDFELEEALTLLERNRDGLMRVHGPDHPLTLMAGANYVETLVDFARFEEAGPLAQELSVKCEEKFGPNSPVTFKAQESQVKWLKASWRWQDAFALNQTISQRYEEFYAPDHPATLSSKVTQGEILYQLERYSDAVELLTNVVQIDKPLPRTHPDRLVGASVLGNCLIKLRQDEAAEAIVDVEASEEVFGAHHPVTLHSRFVLAEVKALRGDLKGAEMDLREVARTLEESAGPDNDLTITANLGLAKNLLAQRNGKDALALFVDLTERVKRTRPAMSSLELALIQEQGQVLNMAREYTQAIALLQPYADAIDEDFERREPRSLSILSTQARAIVGRGDVEGGIAIFERMARINSYHFGPTDGSTLIGEYQLGQLYFRANRHVDGLKLMENAYKSLDLSDLSADPTWKVRFLLNMGRMNNRLERFETAKEHLQQAVDFAKESGIPETVRFVASAHKELSKAQEALKVAE